MPDNLISLAEYADLHGISPATMRQRIMRGLHPEAVKIGRNWLIPADAVYKPDGRNKKAPVD